MAKVRQYEHRPGGMGGGNTFSRIIERDTDKEPLQPGEELQPDGAPLFDWQPLRADEPKEE